MPREYGQLRHDLWNDDDFRALTVPAQHLYMVLVSDPKLTYCGVTGWHAGKLSQRSAENSGYHTAVAAMELADRFMIVIDEETEEVALRSFLRHEPVMSNPRLAVTMTKDFATIASNKIRASIVHELNRLKREHSEWGCWEHPSVRTVLRQNAVSARDMVTDLPIASATYLPSILPSGYPSGLANESTAVNPDPLTRTGNKNTQQETRTTALAVDLDSSSAFGSGDAA